jgi:hypothetical protein
VCGVGGAGRDLGALLVVGGSSLGFMFRRDLGGLGVDGDGGLSSTREGFGSLTATGRCEL